MYRNNTDVALALILALVAMSPTAVGEEENQIIVQLEPLVPDLAGDWALTLEDDVTRYANLSLYQADGEVFGYGYMTFDNTVQKVAAGGSVEDNTLDLYLISIEEEIMFRLNFTVDYGSISGYYRGYSADGARISGKGSGSEYVEGTTNATFVRPIPIPIDPKPDDPESDFWSEVGTTTVMRLSTFNTGDSDFLSDNVNDLEALIVRPIPGPDDPDPDDPDPNDPSTD